MIAHTIRSLWKNVFDSKKVIFLISFWSWALAFRNRLNLYEGIGHSLVNNEEVKYFRIRWTNSQLELRNIYRSVVRLFQ